MTLFICLDNQGGQMFNHRRQSRDRLVSKDIVESCHGKTLYISPYSLPLFEGISAESEGPLKLEADENFLSLAEKDGCAFAETGAFTDFLDKTDRLIIYRWNRTYPADSIPDFRPEKLFRLLDTRDFPGFSHEKITREEYVK